MHPDVLGDGRCACWFLGSLGGQRPHAMTCCCALTHVQGVAVACCVAAVAAVMSCILQVMSVVMCHGCLAAFSNKRSGACHTPAGVWVDSRRPAAHQ